MNIRYCFILLHISFCIGLIAFVNPCKLHGELGYVAEVSFNVDVPHKQYVVEDGSFRYSDDYRYIFWKGKLGLTIINMEDGEIVFANERGDKLPDSAKHYVGRDLQTGDLIFQGDNILTGWNPSQHKTVWSGAAEMPEPCSSSESLSEFQKRYAWRIYKFGNTIAMLPYNHFSFQASFLRRDAGDDWKQVMCETSVLAYDLNDFNTISYLCLVKNEIRRRSIFLDKGEVIADELITPFYYEKNKLRTISWSQVMFVESDGSHTYFNGDGQRTTIKSKKNARGFETQYSGLSPHQCFIVRDDAGMAQYLRAPDGSYEERRFKLDWGDWFERCDRDHFISMWSEEPCWPDSSHVISRLHRFSNPDGFIDLMEAKRKKNDTKAFSLDGELIDEKRKIAVISYTEFVEISRTNKEKQFDRVLYWLDISSLLDRIDGEAQ